MSSRLFAALALSGGLHSRERESVFASATSLMGIKRQPQRVCVPVCGTQLHHNVHTGCFLTPSRPEATREAVHLASQGSCVLLGHF